MGKLGWRSVERWERGDRYRRESSFGIVWIEIVVEKKENTKKVMTT